VPVDLGSLQYRPLADGCPRGAFRCGEPHLDKWFLKHAGKRHDAHTCRVTTVHLADAPEPIGFYAMALVLESDRFLSGDGPIRNRVINKLYPALHLEYLAVDQDHQGEGVGTDMMGRIVGTYLNAVLEFGVPVLTLAPLNDKLVTFYEGLGFRPYAKHIGERRMMLPAQTIIDMARKAGN
jgi:GNAT superfamily N-acetyltransferase